MSNEIVLQAKEVKKSYRSKFGGKKTQLYFPSEVLLSCNESVGILGASGSGKSTLARILLCLLSFDSGEVLYQGKDVRTFSRLEQKEFRKNVQFIAQRPESFFDPRIKFGKSIREAVSLLRKTSDFQQQLGHWMDTMDLPKDLLERYPHQASGGEIQRLAIVRALMVEPQVIVFDEATSMLDVSTQAKIIRLLQHIQKERKLSYLYISHDEALIEKICDRVIKL